MNFDDAVKMVEAAGFSWAIEGHPRDNIYWAIVEKGDGNYVADALGTGLGAREGQTPAAALMNALRSESADQE